MSVRPSVCQQTLSASPSSSIALTLVLQDLKKFNLALQSIKHALLPLFVVRTASGEFNLFDGHQQTRHGVHSEVDGTEGTCTDEGSLDPLEGGFAYKEERRGVSARSEKGVKGRNNVLFVVASSSVTSSSSLDSSSSSSSSSL